MLMKKFVEINKTFQKKNKGKYKSLILFHHTFKHKNINHYIIIGNPTKLQIQSNQAKNSSMKREKGLLVNLKAVWSLTL